ncbi:MAG TPA: FeoA family protein [Nostocaceae cyanobacterium]|nr:FeoA family protein [Nostocaceae cyanobacterium]
MQNILHSFVYTLHGYPVMFTPFSVIGCSLELLKPGAKGIVAFCNHQDETIRKKLIAMGVNTGADIVVEQNFPSFIVKINNTSMTIEQDIARAIYVRVIDN